MNSGNKSFLKNPFFIFLAVWGIINILQAAYTPLDNDEAYYWMYSRHLAWGYFDHPPMIALMIKTGYTFLHNELGLRLMTVIAQLVTLYLVWLTIDKEKREKQGSVILFYMLAVLMPVNLIFGFVSTPDVPLLLFTAVFLYIYKKFLEDDSWQNTILLGLSLAALAYSKYHGAILVALVVLSNLSILKNRKLYVAGILALILFLPHLYWQYANGFPSVKYHLVERVSKFDPSHVSDYLASQLGFQNPFLLVILVWIIIKVKSPGSFERALKFVIVGLLAFFFISSFRYRVEAQWTALVSVPSLILLFNNIDFKPWWRKYIKWVTIALLPVLILARFAAAIDFLPLSFLKNEFHNKKQWVKDVSVIAGDRPVIFTNSYQRPSIYTFYTGKSAFTLDNLNYRKTQYDLWNIEEQMHGKDVLYVPHYFSDDYKVNLTKALRPNGDSIFVKDIRDFQSMQREFVILDKKSYSFSRTDTNSIHIRLFNPYHYSINLQHKELPVKLQVAFFRKNGDMEGDKDLLIPGNISVLNPGDTVSLDCKFTLEDLPAGKYKTAICSEAGILFNNISSGIRDAVVAQ